MNWISIKDRLPGDCWEIIDQKGHERACLQKHACAGTCDYVLVGYHCNYHEWIISIGEYHPQSGWSPSSAGWIGWNECDDFEWDFDQQKITHWMPLPKEPRGE